jgi:polysaccharide biosynthesis/export protein
MPFLFGLALALLSEGQEKGRHSLAVRQTYCVIACLVLSLVVVGAKSAPSTNLGLAWLQSAQSGGSSPQTSDKADKPAKPAADQQNRDKSPKQDPQAAPALTTEQRLNYVIGVEDELQISVWREPELSTSVVVRPDGMITLPLVNDLKAAGLKTEELQNILMEKLKAYVNEPQVTVIVRAIRSRKVSLVGQANHQGSFPLNGDMTALELLAVAGGLGPFAKADSIYILREENGKKIRIPFHYKKAIAGKSENVVLQPGDVMVVP